MEFHLIAFQNLCPIKKSTLFSAAAVLSNPAGQGKRAFPIATTVLLPWPPFAASLLLGLTSGSIVLAVEER
jgi:hypothetical protein